MIIEINNLEDINKAAQKFLSYLNELYPADKGDIFNSGKIIAFYGSMGAGKTTFIKALCEELKVTDTVNSPTFALINEYGTEAGNTVFHFDFYRIKTGNEVFDLGYEDYFYGDDLCLIEWAEKIEHLLPENYVRVNIKEMENGKRQMRVD